MAPPSADDLTVFDMLNSMNTPEFEDFMGQNRAKAQWAIAYHHDNCPNGDDWSEELAEYQQAVRDGEADARQQERDFRDSKGVL